MGLTAERLAEQYGITRAEQDDFAARSQQRYAVARTAGAFDAEMVAVDPLETDEPPRPETTTGTLAGLRPVFLAAREGDRDRRQCVRDQMTGRRCWWCAMRIEAASAGLTPLAVITETASAGCEPSMMGLGPVHAVRRLGRDVNDFDVVELNEAFAAQSLACIRELGLDEARVNPDGGAIAVGHPIGASGARLLVHLAHRARRGGLATLCVCGMGERRGHRATVRKRADESPRGNRLDSFVVPLWKHEVAHGAGRRCGLRGASPVECSISRSILGAGHRKARSAISRSVSRGIGGVQRR